MTGLAYYSTLETNDECVTLSFTSKGVKKSIVFDQGEARGLTAWGFPPCSSYDVEKDGAICNLTTLEDDFLGISFEGEVVFLEAEELKDLKVALYTLLTSGTFAIDCNT